MPTALTKTLPEKLDPTVAQQVVYCIPLWLRDEQIKLATARVIGRIAPHYDRRSEPIAVVGYGPSLEDTWEQVKGFPYIISCSGAHRFLIDRGIIPTWHVEVDPRAHKVQLIGDPHPAVEYLIASACHPAVFDHLEGSKVSLWHVFDNKDEGLRTLPPGEWAITGGCDAGLRAITIAGFLGFRDLHVFGLDGSGRKASHAADHPNMVRKYIPCDYDGVTYQTTPALLEAARGLWHELDQMPAVRARFYGEGLIQHMAKHYTPKSDQEPESMANVVAFTKPELISAEYRQLNARLHRENLAYGVGGERHSATVLKLAASCKTKNILDYGCGKGRLGKAIPFQIAEYDPAIPGKDESPKPADIVVCTDVLEHIEPEKLAFVLGDLARCVRQVGYFVIHTGPASKTLADGRNTHLIQQGKPWWRDTLSKFFNVGTIIVTGPELHVVVGPKQLTRKKAKK